MDENKRQRLKEIGYVIGPTCGTCIARAFRPGSMFGECLRHKYQHLKHTGDERMLSINEHGHCPDYKLDPSLLGPLHGFAEFLKEDE